MREAISVLDFIGQEGNFVSLVKAHNVTQPRTPAVFKIFMDPQEISAGKE